MIFILDLMKANEITNFFVVFLKLFKMFTIILCTLVHHSQDMEMTLMSTSDLMDKETVICICNDWESQKKILLYPIV